MAKEKTSLAEELEKLISSVAGIKASAFSKSPTTMFELMLRERRKPSQEEVDQFRKNKEKMEPWEFYHWYWNLGDKKYEVGDVVTRDGTDEHVIEDIEYDFMTITVRCTKEPWHEECNEPWTRIGEVEPNIIRRYSLIKKSPPPLTNDTTI